MGPQDGIYNSTPSQCSTHARANAMVQKNKSSGPHAPLPEQGQGG